MTLVSAPRVPVAMLVFNRPRETRRVFEAVAAARPPKLLIVGDGPRPDRPDDAALCQETRAIFEAVNWPCEVLTHYADSNLGCRKRVLTGLDWVFSQVGEAIILEDDCLPDPSFFPYCEELLARYRDDERVHMIRGGNFFAGQYPLSTSYHFSRWYHIWGWATWARAWQCTDHSMSRWPELRDSGWTGQSLPIRRMKEKGREILDRAYNGTVDTWEYHFSFMGAVRGAFAICPRENLVTNIGFGPGAAHYVSENHGHSLQPTAPMRFPLLHPRQVQLSDKADLLEWNLTNPRPSLWRRLKRYVRRHLGTMAAATK